jgi:hypothetical protein
MVSTFSKKQKQILLQSENLEGIIKINHFTCKNKRLEKKMPEALFYGYIKRELKK